MIDTSGNEDAHAAPSEREVDGIELRADVAEHETGPDECTIWPHNATGTALLTRWIAAEEGSFCSLEEMR